MPRVELTGTVPFTVTVDTDKREVLEVHVWDEESSLDDLDSRSPQEWVNAQSSTETLTTDDILTAVEIAAEAVWPAWEFGP